MNGSTIQLRGKYTLLLSVVLGGSLLSSCSSGGNEVRRERMSNAVDSSAPSVPAPEVSASHAGTLAQKAVTSTQVTRSEPQLVKKAELALIVNSLDKSIRAASEIVKQQQGDLLGLQEQNPQNYSTPHTASMQIRVPQDQLDSTLDQLAQMGIVQSRTLSAEDVGDQLVDYTARLTNLRKTESTLLKIMERSGSVGDVLKVAQELSNVRQSVEQISAQLKSLQNQVAYSTITLQLEQAVSATPLQRSLGTRVQETWDKSTHSFSEFNISLLRLGIWIMVYSPYLLLLATAIYGYTRLRKSNSQSMTQISEPPNAD